MAYEHSFSTTMRSDTFTDRQTVRNLDGRVIHSVEDARNTRLVTAFAYGAFNQLDHVTDPAGNQIKVHYDQRGRRTWLSDPDAGTTTFAYDGFGDEISRTVGGEQTISDYDVLGRLTQTNHAGKRTRHGATSRRSTIRPRPSTPRTGAWTGATRMTSSRTQRWATAPWGVATITTLANFFRAFAAS